MAARSLSCASFTALLRIVTLAIFVIPVFSLAAPSTSGHAAPIVIQSLGKGFVPLNGPWQFHLGDDPSYASPALDDLTGHDGWEQLSPDKPWGVQGHPAYVGYAWYRRHIELTPAPGASPDIALLVPPVADSYEIYWNGVLVGSGGKLPPHPVWYFLPPPLTFGLGPVRSGVLAFRVWKSNLASFDSGRLGGFTMSPFIGSPQAIANLKETSDNRWLRSRQFLFGLDSLYFLIAMFGLLGWLRDRSQWIFLWMGCFAASAPLVDLLEGMRLPIPWAVTLGLSQPLFGLISISTWFVLILLLGLDDNPRFRRTIRFLAIFEMVCFSLDGLVVLSIPYTSGSVSVAGEWIDAFLTAIFTILQSMPLFIVGYAVIRRPRLAPERWLVAACAFFAAAIPTLRSGLAQGSRYTHWTISNKIGAPLFTVNGNAVTAQTIAQAALLLALAYAVYRYSAEERRRQARLEQEFRNARELQQILIPEAIPNIPGFTLTSAYKPAQEVGGDFFQIIPLDEKSAGSTLIVLGDVSGKGLTAAMTVSLIVGVIRALAEITASPAEILAGLNRRLNGRLHGGFATAIALRLDPDGRCTLASAGHPAPFLNRHELEMPGALPLGLVSSTTYDEHAFQLQDGDHLALYTDGLLEARNTAGELYGFDRLTILFGNRPTAEQASIEAVTFGQDDDITVLTLRRAVLA